MAYSDKARPARGKGSRTPAKFPDPIPPAEPPAWSHAAKALAEEKSKVSVGIKISVDETWASVPVPEGTKPETLALAEKPVLQWKNYQEEERPYKTPRDEFIMCSVQIPEAELRRRWEGLGHDAQLDLLFGAATMLDRTREQLRYMVKNDGNGLDITDPEFQKKANENSYVLFETMKQLQSSKIQIGLEPETVTMLDETTGRVTRARRMREMTANEEEKRYRIISDSEKQQRLLMGQSTEIVGHQNLDLTEAKKKAAAQALADWRKAQYEGYAKAELMSVTTPALESGEAVEGEVEE